MAFDPINIDPLNLRSSKAIGISIPFNGEAIFNQTFTTKDDIKSSILNLFLTEQGEHYLNINFGSGIRNFLFEQKTPALNAQLEIFITEQLAAYFPTVDVEKIDISSDPNDNTVSIVIKYIIINTNETDTVNIFL